MAKNEKIVAIDIGAASIKLCEFEYAADNSMRLNAFACREYEEELSDATRIGVVTGLLRQMLAENGIHAKKALLSMSGQSALMRFNKIPAGNYDRKQIVQLAEFEARRNIPFDIKDVIVDYQLIAPESDSEFVDVMSVVIKNDIVKSFIQAVTDCGLEPLMVDVSPVACYNAARANGFGENECVAILDIGGRTTNLMFVEGDRFFARSIPIAGATITQQIAKEFGVSTPEAEELKRHHGFVALGGAYAEPESETAAAVSKIIRNVMTRLHGEISRSISIYKAQQKGNAPVKLYLTGGTSILTYCDVFFKEKLGVDVEYFNPFGATQISPRIQHDKLSEVAHQFASTIGLGLRFQGGCPVEINALPQDIRRQQALSAKKPFFFAAMLVILLMLYALLYGVQVESKKVAAEADVLGRLRQGSESKFKDVESAEANCASQISEYGTLKQLLLQRTMWPCVLNEIYRLKPDDIWITNFEPIMDEVTPFEPTSLQQSNDSDSMGMGGGVFGGGMPAMGGGAPMMGGGGAMGGGAMGGTGNNSSSFESEANIAGFLIDGVCVDPNDTNKVAVTETRELEFPYQAAAAPAAEEKAEGSSDDESAADAESAEEAPKKAIPTTPEYMFVELLRSSSLFSSDETITALTKSTPASVGKNAGTFTIQVGLETPISYTKYGNEDLFSDASPNKDKHKPTGGMGGAGGPMMGPMGGGASGGSASARSSSSDDL